MVAKTGWWTLRSGLEQGCQWYDVVEVGLAPGTSSCSAGPWAAGANRHQGIQVKS